MTVSLLETTKSGRGRASHKHFVITVEEGKQGTFGLCSEGKNGHRHDVQWVWDVEPQIDPQTQQLAVDPQSGQPIQPGEGHFEVGPAEDGHTHELVPFEEREVEHPGKDETDSETVRAVYEHWKTLYDLESDEFEEFDENEKFYQGDHWDENDRKKLKDSSRACLTLNVTGVEIDRLCGYQQENAQDFAFSPQEGGDDMVAEILNIISKIDMRNCNFGLEEAEVFLDMCIGGRGNFNAYIDHEEDIEGVIKFERIGWQNVRYGAHEKIDARDCEVITKDRVYSKMKLEQLFSEKAGDIQSDFKLYVDMPASIGTDEGPDAYSNMAGSYRANTTYRGNDLVNITKKEFRLVERHMKVYQKVHVFAFPTENHYERIEGLSEADAKALESLEGAHLFEQRVSKIRITKVAGNTLLEDQYPADLALDDFHVVPSYAHKRGNKFWGKVNLAKDANRNLNKFMSQLTDIMARMSAHGWYYDSLTFPDPKEEKRFKKNSAKPGFTQRVSSTNRLPVKEEGAPLPNGLNSIIELLINYIIELLNVKVESAGANESGSKFLQRQKAKLAGNQHLFTHLSIAKKKLGKLYVAMVQKYYTPERIYRMIESQSRKQALKLGGQEFSKYPRGEVVRLLTVADLSRYDVDVIDSPTSPTARLATSLLLIELAQAGVEIPPEILIEKSEIPATTKTDILEGYQAQSEAAAEESADVTAAELEKTAMAQGIMTPQIAEKIGLPTEEEDPNQPPIVPGQQGEGAQI